MANENKNINELVLDDDDPTAELDVTELRAAVRDDASVASDSDTPSRTVDEDDDASRIQSVSELQLDLDERSETVGRLQSDIERLHSKWLGLETEISAREEVVRDLEKEVDELKSQVARKSKLLKKRDKKIKKLRSEDSDRRRDHVQLVEEHAVTWQQLAEHTTAASEQAKALENAMRELEAARSGLRAESEKVATLDAELKIRDEAQASLERHHMALTDELEDLRSIDTEHIAALDKADVEIQGMQADLKTAGAKISGLEMNIAESDEAKRLLDEQHAELQHQVEEQRSAIAAKELALESVEHELQKTSFELKKILDQGPPEIVLADISRSDAQEIQAQIARTEKYADTLRHNLHDLTESHAAVVDERDRLSKMLERMATENAKLSEEITKANTLISEKQAVAEEQQMEQQVVVDQLKSDHEQDIRNLRFELGEAQDTLTETTNINEQLASELRQAREFKEDLEGMLSQNDEQAKGHIEDLEKQIKLLNRTTEEFEQKLETKSAAINALLDELAKKSEQFDSISEIEEVIHDIDDRMSGRLDDGSAADESTPEPDIGPARGDRERVSRVMIGNIGNHVLRFPLFKDQVTIGRTGDNDIQLKTAYVSRRHAVLLTEGDSTRVVDWGSRNGVFVNSRRVEEHLLSNGDIVTVGDAKFRYEERQKFEST